MINTIFKDYKTIHLAIITSMLLAVSSLHAEESVALESFSDGTKEYLSDPARTGSLVGSILAGAAIANPLAPLLGGVAGFFIGKSSDYSAAHSNSRQSANFSRSFMPKDGVQITSLTGLTGKKPTQESEQKAVFALAEETGAQGSKLQQQLASACSHVGLSQPLPVHCYYYSQ